MKNRCQKIVPYFLYIVVSIILARKMFLAGNMLSGTDMLTFTYEVDFLKKYGLRAWWPTYDLGQPSPLFQTYQFPLLLAYIIPANSIISTAIVVTFLIALAGISMFVLLNKFISKKWINFILGLAYQFHPFILAQYWEGHVRALYSVALFPLTINLIIEALKKEGNLKAIVFSLLAALIIANGHPQFVYIESIQIITHIIVYTFVTYLLLRKALRQICLRAFIVITAFLITVVLWSLPYLIIQEVKLTHLMYGTIEELQRNSWGFFPALAVMPGDISYFMIGFNIHRIDPYLPSIVMRPILAALPIFSITVTFIIRKMYSEKRVLIYSFLLTSLIFILLSAGISSTTKQFYSILIEHLPYFNTVRVPQRWNSFTLIADIICIAFVIESLFTNTFRLKISHTRKKLKCIAYLISSIVLLSSTLLSYMVIVYPPESFNMPPEFHHIISYLNTQNVSSNSKFYNILLAPYGWTYQDDRIIMGEARSPAEALALYTSNKGFIYNLGGTTTSRTFLVALGKTFEHGDRYLSALLGALGVKYAIVRKWQPGISSMFNPAVNWVTIRNQYGFREIMDINGTLWLLNNPYYRSFAYSSNFVYLSDKGFQDLLLLSKVFTLLNKTLPPVVFLPQLAQHNMIEKILESNLTIIPIIHINDEMNNWTYIKEYILRNIVLSILTEKLLNNEVTHTEGLLLDLDGTKEVQIAPSLYPEIVFQTFSPNVIRIQHDELVYSLPNINKGQYLIFIRLMPLSNTKLRLKVIDEDYVVSKVYNLKPSNIFKWIGPVMLSKNNSKPIKIVVNIDGDSLLDVIIMVKKDYYLSLYEKLKSIIMKTLCAVIADIKNLYLQGIKLLIPMPMKTIIFNPSLSPILIFQRNRVNYLEYDFRAPIVFIHYLDSRDRVWKEFWLEPKILKNNNSLMVYGNIPRKIIERARLIELYIVFNQSLINFVKYGRIVEIRGISPILPYNIFVIGLNYKYYPKYIDHAHWNNAIRIIGDVIDEKIRVQYFFTRDDIERAYLMTKEGANVASLVITGKPALPFYKITITIKDPVKPILINKTVSEIMFKPGYYIVIGKSVRNKILALIPIISNISALEYKYYADYISINTSLIVKPTLIVVANSYNRYWDIKNKELKLLHVPVFGVLNGFIIKSLNTKHKDIIIFFNPPNVYLMLRIIALFLLVSILFSIKLKSKMKRKAP